MRYFYDSTSKRQPWCVQVDAVPDESGRVADIELQLYHWNDAEAYGRVQREALEVTHREQSSVVYGRLLALFDRAGLWPSETDADALEDLTSRAVARCVRTL